MRAVISDTGPILHLYEADALELLRSAGEILLPRAVDAELGALIPSWATLRPSWLAVTELAEAAEVEARGWEESGLLDPGEAEALALAQQVDARWLLTDDTAARLLGIRLGIEVHGSLGVVLWAAAVGNLDKGEARGTLGRLFGSTLWVSARVRAEATAALDALFEG